MKIICPNCNTQIENNNINVTENICVCQSCSQLYKLSEMQDQEKQEQGKTEVTENALLNPPKGIKIQKDGAREIITVSAKSKSVIILILFALIFSGFTAFAFYKITETEPPRVLIFMLPFLLGIILLWIHAFFMMFGKFELVINPKEPDYLFKGMGTLGKKYFIDWPSIKNISEVVIEKEQYENSGDRYGRRHGGRTTVRYLQIEGKKLIKITINEISKEKSGFLVNALNYYKERKLRYQQYFTN